MISYKSHGVIEPGLLNSIFARVPNLEKLRIGGMGFEQEIEDYQLLFKSIREKKLKSLKLHSSIKNINSFKLLCESLSDSEIETFGIEPTFSQELDEEETNYLIKVIPEMKFLKHLDLRHHSPNLFRALEQSNVEHLKLVSANLEDGDAVMLAKLILSSKLMELDVRYNFIGREGIMALEAAKEMKPGFNLNVEEQSQRYAL